MANKKRTPLGVRHVDMTLSGEVVAALSAIKRESGSRVESTSQFVDNWLRQHPRIKEYLEQQEKGNDPEYDPYYDPYQEMIAEERKGNER